eukprot:scaffold11298_cov21-Phaeocystis_antarctica.AAC.1
MGRACRAASARGEGGYGSAASPVPARQRSFCTPGSDHRTTAMTIARAMDERAALAPGAWHDTRRAQALPRVSALARGARKRAPT